MCVRFTYLDPAAREFWRDDDQIANDAAAMLRLEAGRHPHGPELIRLVGELSTQGEVFMDRWAATHDDVVAEPGPTAKHPQ